MNNDIESSVDRFFARRDLDKFCEAVVAFGKNYVGERTSEVPTVDYETLCEMLRNER